MKAMAAWLSHCRAAVTPLRLSPSGPRPPHRSGGGHDEPDPIILVEGGRITAVGGSVLIPKGAAVDLPKVVLPGLFDVHASA